MAATGTAAVDSDRRLLRACCDLTAGRTPRASFAGEEASALRTMLAAHGLSGLASRAVEDYTLVLPDVVAEAVRVDWLAARQWCSALDAECLRVGEAGLALISEGLHPPMLVKGRSVARRYGDPGLRTYVDFDLLVPVREFDAWAAFLAEQGYHGPPTELAATRRRYQHSVALARPSPEGALGCDLHTCLFVERTARDITYEALSVDAFPSEFPGLCQPAPAAQLLVLALHFVQHPASDRRLIWARDFIELGDADTVAGARQLAAAHGVGWALESALSETEAVLGRRAWNACQSQDEGGSQARAHRLERPEYLHHLALVRELGVVAGVRYVVSRVDPRRFAGSDGAIDWRAFTIWVRSAGRKATRTPWTAWRRSSRPSGGQDRAGHLGGTDRRVLAVPAPSRQVPRSLRREGRS